MLGQVAAGCDLSGDWLSDKGGVLSRSRSALIGARTYRYAWPDVASMTEVTFSKHVEEDGGMSLSQLSNIKENYLTNLKLL